MTNPRLGRERGPHGLRTPRGLRFRIAFMFTFGALLIVAVLSATTYLLAARYLVGQRERTAQRQAFVDARLVRDSLLTTNDPRSALGALELAQNSAAAIHRDGQWLGTARAAQPESMPAGLRHDALAGAPVRQRYDALGTPRITTAVPLPAVHATYFEIAALVELRSTLRALRNILIVTSIATTVAAMFAGTWAGRRVLRPVSDVSRVAATIAGGDLGARLTPGGDPDLDRVVESFNEMADALPGADRSRRALRVGRESRTAVTAHHACDVGRRARTAAQRAPTAAARTG